MLVQIFQHLQVSGFTLTISNQPQYQLYPQYLNEGKVGIVSNVSNVGMNFQMFRIILLL